VVDKKWLIVDRIHHKQFEMLPGWYLSEYITGKNTFQVRSTSVVPA